MFDRSDVIEYLANHFDIDPDDDGRFDLDSYDWTAGCAMSTSLDGKWLCLAEVVNAIDDLANDFGIY